MMRNVTNQEDTLKTTIVGATPIVFVALSMLAGIPLFIGNDSGIRTSSWYQIVLVVIYALTAVVYAIAAVYWERKGQRSTAHKIIALIFFVIAVAYIFRIVI